MTKLRLGVNVDHVATVRQARGGDNPDPVRAAILAQSAGADGITAHLREDRRHISDDDIARLSKALTIPLNLEMAATDEMAAIALKHKPHAACIVPEKREERTTEGGIDAVGQHNRLQSIVSALGAARIRVSMFIEPDRKQIDAAPWARRWWNCTPAPMPMPRLRNAIGCWRKSARPPFTAKASVWKFMPVTASLTKMSNRLPPFPRYES